MPAKTPITSTRIPTTIMKFFFLSFPDDAAENAIVYIYCNGAQLALTCALHAPGVGDGDGESDGVGSEQ